MNQDLVSFLQGTVTYLQRKSYLKSKIIKLVKKNFIPINVMLSDFSPFTKYFIPGYVKKVKTVRKQVG